MFKKSLKAYFVLMSMYIWSAFAQYYISPYDPVYFDLTYLSTNGYFKDLNFHNQPLMPGDIRTSIEVNDYTKLIGNNAIALKIIDKFKKGYCWEDSLSQSPSVNGSRVNGNLNLGILLNMNYIANNELILSELYQGREEISPGFYPQVRTLAVFKPLHNLSVVNVMTIDPYTKNNPNYIGKEWRGLSGYTEQAYFLYKKEINNKCQNRIVISGGRSYLMYGPGVTGKLLLSSASRPMDNFKVDLRIGNLYLSSTFAQLDRIDNKSRFLTFHRFSYNCNRFTLGVSEVVLYGGAGRSFEMAYLNPLLFFHGENVNGPDLNGNTLGNIDFTYKGRKWQLYGEILVDDFQFDKKEPGDLEPNEIGSLVGIHLADPFGILGLYLGSEFVAITNRTYKTVEKYEWFIHRNVPIGYYAGSDLVRWNTRITKYFGNCRISGILDWWWRGEGEMSKPWDSPWDTCSVKEGYHEKFPTGIVELIRRGEVKFEWIPKYDLNFTMGLVFQRINNKNHIDNSTKGLIFYCGFLWNFSDKFKIF